MLAKHDGPSFQVVWHMADSHIMMPLNYTYTTITPLMQRKTPPYGGVLAINYDFVEIYEKPGSGIDENPQNDKVSFSGKQ